MPLPSGQSEIDSMVIRLPRLGIDLDNWSRYNYSQRFGKGTVEWSFQVAGDDLPQMREVLSPGAEVQLLVNGLAQCTGFVERATTSGSSQSGTTLTVRGRDILGPVTYAGIPPSYKFTAGTRLLDAVLAALAPHGIKLVHGDDLLNVNAMTGRVVGKTAGTTQVVTYQVPKRTQAADGTISIVYEAQKGTIVTNPGGPLKKVKLDQIKPKPGEGVYAFLDRILRRHGLLMWALGDGSGVVIGGPDYTTTPVHKLIHRRSDGGRYNNVTDYSQDIDLTQQPGVIVGFGMGGGRSMDKSRLKVAMVNELVGLDDNGDVLPSIKEAIAQIKGIKVLPVRAELRPARLRSLGATTDAQAMYMHDEDAQNLEQLESSVRREMATRQEQAFGISYDVIGHTQNGAPWAVNTLIDVEDEVLDVNGPLWCVERAFTKSTQGTATMLRLIRPNVYRVST